MASIPVGPEGVTYKHVGIPEVEPFGPAALALSETGELYVLDSAGLGVVEVIDTTHRRIPLAWARIQSLLDLALADGRIRILHVDRLNLAVVYEVTSGGSVTDTIELPPGLRLENGLSGIATGPEGQLWIELEGAARVAELNPGSGEYTVYQGYPYPDGVYGPRFEEPFPESIPFEAGDITVTLRAQPGNSIGGSLLGINPDGSFVVETVESGQDENFILSATTRAHWYQPDGSLTAVADLPLEDQFIYVDHPAALGPDGHVYYLQTQPETSVVLKLAWRPRP